MDRQLILLLIQLRPDLDSILAYNKSQMLQYVERRDKSLGLDVEKIIVLGKIVDEYFAGFDFIRCNERDNSIIYRYFIFVTHDDGGDDFRNDIENGISTILKEGVERLFSLKNEFNEVFHDLKNGRTSKFKLTKEHFPFYVRGKFSEVSVDKTYSVKEKVIKNIDKGLPDKLILDFEVNLTNNVQDFDNILILVSYQING